MSLENRVYANENEMDCGNSNIVFLVDHSGSMNSRDKQRMIPDTLKAFIDTAPDENMKIGYVAYNDKIIAQQAPVLVSMREQCTELKEAIDSAEYQGETDIGLGLRKAYQMLQDLSGKKMIVLISDGETDLENSGTGRTNEDSDRDVREICQKCREENIAVTTIALEKENEEGLRQISAESGGESCSLQEPEELFITLCGLFCTGPGYSVNQTENSIYDEGSQKISYESAGSTDELAILLFSDKEIANIDILYDSNMRGDGETAQTAEHINPEIAGNYAVFKTDGDSGKFTISFDTEQKQQMKMFVIGKRNIRPVVEWTQEVSKNKAADFKIYFRDKEGNNIDLYGSDTGMKWVAEFENLQTGEIVQPEMTESAQNLSGTVTFHHSGEYSLNLYSGGKSPGFPEIIKINVTNTLPDGLSAEPIELLTVSGEKTVDLNDFFSDQDGDKLTFSLQELPEDIVKAQIQDNRLLLKPEGRGRGEIKLCISDKEGSLMASIPVRIRSLPEAYWQVVLGLVCIVAFCIAKLYGRRKNAVVSPGKLPEKNENSFTGKLNAYFTLLPKEMEEIPPLTFALHPVREKKIILKDMFSDYPELSDLLMLDNIFLFPAENRKMILYHDSDSAVMIGNSIVCRKMQYIVGYGNVIYITSKDGTCELEVHYISMI